MCIRDRIKVYDSGVHFTEDPDTIRDLRVGYRTGDMWAPKLEDTEALSVAVEHFADCISRQQVPLTDARLGVRIIQLIEASNRSIRERGRSVTIGSEVVRS